MVEFDNSNEENPEPMKSFLKDFKATDNNFSILMFTTGFEGEKLKISNCDNVIFNSAMKTNERQPVAEILRIENTCMTKVRDVGHHIKFELKSDLLRQYKFVYVSKDYNRNKRYIIVYSNKFKRIL